MRHEEQPWNDVRITLEVVDEGVGITGLSPTCTVQRTVGGTYLQSGGGWGGSPSNLSLLDAGGGLYVYQVSSTDLDTTDGSYIVRISESTYDILENLLITTKIPAGDQRKLFDSLCQRVKFKPTAWDSTSKQPTAGTIYVYASDALYNADTVPDGTGAYASWDVEATFSSGQLQVYGRKPA